MKTFEKVYSSPWIGPGWLTAWFFGLAAWSWRKWPDMVIDFGAQLYMPWQIVQGKALYMDIAWKHGPFSQYFNALWFWIFGVSFTTLMVVNLTLLAIMTWLAYCFFLEISDRLTATTVSWVLLCVFGFSQYVRTGIFNFVTPYSHETTHGILFSFSLMVFLVRGLRQPSGMNFFLAGFSLGLVFLTKIEITLAAGGAALVGFTLHCLSESYNTQKIRQLASLLLSGILTPITLCFLLLWFRMPFGQAIRGLCGNWAYLVGSGIGDNTFYQAVTGLDHPGSNLWLMFKFFGIILIGVGSAFGIDFALRKVENRALWCLGVGGATFLTLSLVKIVPWQDLGRPLPLTTALVCVAAIRLGIMYRRDQQLAPKFIALASWAIFALLLLMKIVLYSRLYDYGFALAMPATLLLVACLSHFLPTIQAHWNSRGDVLRAILLAGVVSGVIYHLGWSQEFYQYKTFPIGTGSDRMLAYQPEVDLTGYGLFLADGELQKLAPPGATLLVLPEGIMLNYLERRTNPTPFMVLTPFDISAYGGESTVLDSIKSHQPDFIVLIHRRMDEFNVGYFGNDPAYGKQIMDWIVANYQQVKLFGAPPLKDDRFGIAILRRNAQGK